MTNAELIKALRYCANDLPCETESYRCKYADIRECNVQLRVDAADALEAAEKRIEELEAQMPKEGEWLDEQRGRWIYATSNTDWVHKESETLEKAIGDFYKREV